MQSENLSEELFKTKFKYEETSMISNSGVELPKLSYEDSAYGFTPSYYRPIHRFNWVIGGGNVLDIDEALAKISVSKNERSRPKCLDTVKEYGPGHWIYEFSTIAQSRVTKAHAAMEKGDMQCASHNFRMAARYFGIAAYPNLKSDVLALHADVLCIKYYKQMFEVDPNLVPIKEETFTVDGKKVTGYLHLPDTESMHPCLVVACSYENSIEDHFRLFTNYLKPNNIAMFLIEMPGKGACDKLNLGDHFSLGVEAALEHLSTLNCIDSTKIALMGRAFAATTCIRASLMKPNLVKALIAITPFVHSIFTEKEFLDSMPLCLRSSLCNRLNLDASNWEILIPRFKAFSLKNQGILSNSNRCTTPTLVCTIKNSYVSGNDITLLENNYKDFSLYEHENEGYSAFAKDSIERISKFLVEKLSKN